MLWKIKTFSRNDHIIITKISKFGPKILEVDVLSYFCFLTLCYDNNSKFINCERFAKTSQVLGWFMTKLLNCHCVMGLISIVTDPWRYLKTLRIFRQNLSQIKWFLVVMVWEIGLNWWAQFLIGLFGGLSFDSGSKNGTTDWPSSKNGPANQWAVVVHVTSHIIITIHTTSHAGRHMAYIRDV